MNEYQVVVARDGQFLFRTDWDHRQERVQSAVDVLQAAGLQVEVMARVMARVMASVPRMTCVTEQFTGVAE